MSSRKNAKQKNTSFRFQGFSAPHYTQVPDELFDTIMPHLSGAELKVLLYIVRRTFGFKKQYDAISLSQMVDGITTKDGKELDQGTGVSKASVARAVKKLEDMNIIMRVRNQSRGRGFEPTTYALNMREPLSQNETTPSPKMKQAMSHPRDIQQTAVQQTERQEAAPAAALSGFGIDKPTVDRLVNNYDAELIAQKIDYVAFMQEQQPNQVRNPRGWLLKAIENDYGPPAGYRSSKERDKEAALKERRAQLTEKQRMQMQQALEAATINRVQEEEKILEDLRRQYGTTEELISLWQEILEEIKDSTSGLTYAFVKAIHLLAIEEDIAIVAAQSKYSVEKIKDNSLGELLDEMFRHRGYNLKDIKPVIMKKSVP